MVIPDLNYSQKSSESQNSASVPIRVLAFVIDYFIFSPVVSFCILIFFRQGVELYKSFPRSEESQVIFLYLFSGFVFISTLFQALFITFWGATPGQYFLKLQIRFNNSEIPLFLQAWFRQLGFVSSFFLLGIPFFKTLIDEKGRCFYEKMTDSEVVCRWPMSQSYKLNSFHSGHDKKFWSAAMTTMSIFSLCFLALIFWRGYENTITSPITYSKIFQKKQTCSEFSELSSTERLRHKIAMNLVGTLSEECLDQEADFVLWRNFSDDQSLAYFAKFISTNDSELEIKYLEQACDGSKENEGCYWATIFKTNQFDDVLTDEKYKSTVLGQIVTYELNDHLDLQKKKEILNSLNKKSNYKSIKKFIVSEKIDFMLKNKEQSRSPASSESNEDLENIKEMINNL